MRKKLVSLLLAGVLLIPASTAAYAETSYGSSDWSVSFTTDEKMESNFKTSDLDDVVYGLQPGDNVILTLGLENKNDTTTDWYMTNEVLYSLEDRSANAGTSGGAYTYILTYTDKDGNATTLFSSDTVGGEKDSQAGEGLNEATSALTDYFYLDTLMKGQSGSVTLEVALDGETQGNDYQDTLADLQMNFAVELAPDVTPNSPPTVREPGDTPDDAGSSTGFIRTGDESDLAPFILAACITGGLLLIIAFYGRWENKRQKKGVQP